MLEKRDLQLVRLAVRRKWLTAEEGEDCLFLKRKLGERYPIEEVIRKRGYLDDAALAELSAATEQLTRRRPAAVKTVAPARAPVRPDPAAPSTRASTARDSTVVHQPPIAAPSRRLGPQFDDDSTSFDAEIDAPSIATARPPLAVAPDDPVMGARAAIHTEPPDAFVDEPTVVGFRVDDVMLERHRAQTVRPSNPDVWPARRSSIPPQVRPSASPPVRPSAPPPPPPRPPIIAPSARVGAERVESLPDEVIEAPQWAEPSVDEPVRPPLRRVKPGLVRSPTNLDNALLGPQGEWILRRVIGRGATAVVYLAEPIDGGEAVALKLLKDELVSSTEAVERFRREAEAAAVIDSPHVVPLRGKGYLGERPYIAFQYIDGFTLRERLDTDEPPDLAQALEITREVALALAAAEKVGIVHRDVTPENVMVRSSGEVYLTDFGLARSVADAPSGLTMIPRGVVGTPSYMAPEQGMGGIVDHRSDLYALGATLFHVLTGRPPFEGRTAVSIITKHARDPVPDLVAIDSRIPPEVAALIQRLMAKSPQDRFASALELVFAIDQLLAALLPQAKVERVVAPAAIASFVVSALLTASALAAAVSLRRGGLAAWGNGHTVGLETAFSGAGLVSVAMLMLGAIGLVRRGELPLPGSTSWLVTLKDATGVLGAGLVLVSAALGPPAALDVVVLTLGAAVLGSWVFGFFLRTAIARQRRDRGGHMLALFGDVRLRRWRRVHVPLLVTLSGLASARFAVLAYFWAGS